MLAVHIHATLRHLIVDEYQDIKPAQERLIELLTGPNVERGVVGEAVATDISQGMLDTLEANAARLGLEPRGYLLVTIHREANVRRPRIGRIVEGLPRLDEPLVFSAQPRTRAALEAAGLELPLVQPLGYLDLAALAQQARVILTDSGGLQKEAYWYGVPCVTARPSTEWVDTVEAGANVDGGRQRPCRRHDLHVVAAGSEIVQSEKTARVSRRTAVECMDADCDPSGRTACGRCHAAADRADIFVVGVSEAASS